MGHKSKSLVWNRLAKKILCFYVIILMFFSIFSTYSVSNEPNIEFKYPPTPEGVNNVTDQTYANIGVYVNDTNYNSSFINWNNSLVGYWNFEHYNDMEVRDNSSYEYNASFVGTNFGQNNITTNGIFGKALYFNSTDKDYLNCSNEITDKITNQITIELWLKENATSFNRTFGERTNSSCNERGYDIQQTSDGGYIIVGEKWNTTSGIANDYDIWLIKTDSFGNELWDKTFDGGYNKHDTGYSVQQTNDNGYILTGYISNGTEQKDIVIIKTDENGSNASGNGWIQIYGNTSDYDDEGYSIEQTLDGGYILTGYTRDSGNQEKNIIVIKTDQNGSNATENDGWTQVYGSVDYKNEEGKSIKQTADGRYILTGYNNFSFPLETDSGLLVYKLDSSGNKIDEYLEDVDGDECGYDIELNDQGYIVAGIRDSPTDTSSAWLIKLDNDLNKQDEGRYDITEYTPSLGQCAYSVNQTNDGGYILTGYYDKTGTESGLLLLKADSNLDEEWNRTFNNYKNGIEGRAVQQTNDGGYVIVGNGTFNELTNDSDIWFIKTDELGNIIESNNNQSLNKTLIGKGTSYGINLYNGTLSGHINGEYISTDDIGLYNLTTNWHYAALTYNGSTINFYLNNTPAYTVQYSGQISTNFLDDLIIGKNFSGTMDEVRIWNRALSWEEINASYNCSGSYYRNFTDLPDSEYSYYVYAINQTGGENQTEDRSITIDTLGPVISSISSGTPSTTSATITWTTNEDATSNVEYGTTESYGNWSNSSTYTTSHSIPLTGLSSSTTYYYRVLSYDQAGNENSSLDGTGTFTTTESSGGWSPPQDYSPTARSGGPYNGTVGTPVQFNGSASTAATGRTISLYNWNFGDGSPGTGVNPTHTYTTAGTYTVRLTVTDNQGSSGAASTTATIETTAPDYPPEILEFYHLPSEVTSNDNVTIFAKVIDDRDIPSVVVYWGSDGQKVMTKDGIIYSAEIGQFPENAKVEYWITATDTTNPPNISAKKSFTVVVKREVGNVSGGEEQDVVVGSGAINRIKFKTSTTLENVNITIEYLTENEITFGIYNDTGIVYQYLNMTITANDTYVTEFESLTINFTVNKTWFEEHKNNISSIDLYRYHNNEWKPITTNMTYESETDHYYEAEIPGLSTFAVVGSKVVEKNTETTQTPEIPWLFIIGFIIAGLAALIFVLFKAKLIYVEVEEVDVPKKE